MRWYKMCELCKNKGRLGEICLNCHRQKIQEAKKEIFDDLEKDKPELKNFPEWERWKQTHL